MDAGDKLCASLYSLTLLVYTSQYLTSLFRDNILEIISFNFCITNHPIYFIMHT